MGRTVYIVFFLQLDAMHTYVLERVRALPLTEAEKQSALNWVEGMDPNNIRDMASLSHDSFWGVIQIHIQRCVRCHRHPLLSIFLPCR